MGVISEQISFACPLPFQRAKYGIRNALTFSWYVRNSKPGVVMSSCAVHSGQRDCGPRPVSSTPSCRDMLRALMISRLFSSEVDKKAASRVGRGWRRYRRYPWSSGTLWEISSTFNPVEAFDRQRSGVVVATNEKKDYRSSSRSD